MTTAHVIYADVRQVIDHPIDVVWAPIARFGGLEQWAAGVVSCEVEGEGLGAIRTVSLGGRTARERLELLEPSSHWLRYHVLPPHSMPADDVYSNTILTAIGESRTEMIWRSEAVNFRIPPEQLGHLIEAFYNESIEGLRRMLDAG